MSKGSSSVSAAAAARAEPTASQSAATVAALSHGRAKSRASAEPPEAADKGGPRKGRKPPTYAPLGRGLPTSAQQRAAAILEVLAGEQTAAQAARALGVSPMHYYLLERRALQGLVAACAPRPKGPSGPRPEQELVRLRRELERSHRECQRQTALVRATQRALGFPAAATREKPEKTREKPQPAGGKRPPRRRATVRALRAAQSLRQNSSGPAAADLVEPSSVQGSTTEATLPRPEAIGTSSSPLAETAGSGVGEFGYDTDGTQAGGHGTRGPPAGLARGQAADESSPADTPRRAVGAGGL